jgi:monovalent cation/proton antiporter MnhG/PhaG subunit
MLAILGVLALALGLAFSLIGVLGSIRLPDVFLRLHAASKVSSLGMFGLLLGSALLLPDTAPKALALGVFVLVSAPIASHAIARAAYRDGCILVGLEQNDLGTGDVREPSPTGALDPLEQPAPACTHLHWIQLSETTTHVCEQCVALGDSWVHLRMCLSCGTVGCCDSSKNRHARRHFLDSGHPIMRSIEPGEEWRWCYVDQRTL